jgi:hypothetical protein
MTEFDRANSYYSSAPLLILGCNGSYQATQLLHLLNIAETTINYHACYANLID